jgi:broad specificity phosphatase PhoE
MIRRHPIYFLRHGETESNASGRMQGHLDSKLTAKGESQAAAMAAILSRLVDGDSTDIVSSPLGRAVQTADIVGRTLRTPDQRRRTDIRLREMTWGAWDGFTLTEIQERWPQEWHARQADRWNCPPPNGESYAMLRERVAPAFWEIFSDDRPVIVIAHGVVGRVVRGLHLSLDPPAIMALDEPQGVVMRLDDRGVTALK